MCVCVYEAMVDMTTIDFSMSGQGQGSMGSMGLPAWQQLAVSNGFVKSTDESKPLAQRADMQGMFKKFNVTSLSSFKQLFYSTKLTKSGHKEVAVKAKADAPAAAVAVDFKCPDVSEYDTLSQSWDGNQMKWRMIQKPGGAHMKPTDWYRCGFHLTRRSIGMGTLVGRMCV